MITKSSETSQSKIDAESEKLEAASPAPKSEQPIPKSGQAAAESSPVHAKKPETRSFQHILRTALIALAAVIAVFLAGFLTDHLARYSPMKAMLTENLTQTQDELSQANQTISDLLSQIDNLTTNLTAANDRIAALEQDKENMQSDLDSASLHIELLTVLGELKTAHIEFKNDNIAGAKVALSNTAANLENLKPLVETVDANLAANMQTRLDLILTGMDTDSANTLADLGLLTKNLQSVETLLFDKK
jgi:septal ring factor EnvC (AmiA/AmiB activator)